ncbi:MAG: hypothetical protein K1X74_18395 [Pirellulales bacterium]|nr:hypothetical protein [Pirellulales bacterium]
MNDSVRGVLVGALIGALAGLGACIWILPETPFFPGDTILIGAVVCGVCGHRWGDSFFDWLRDHWHWFV